MWDDQEYARKVMRRMSRLRDQVESWRRLQEKVADAIELASLDDEGLREDIEAELAEIEAQVERREFLAMLSGKHDRDDAILAIHAGAGGTDSQDWAHMLQRMYLRWGESHDYETDILDLSEGEEAGLKSVTISIEGDFAYGYLQAEKGVHRLVRISPFDASNRRHTSFALVEVYPQVETDDDVQVKSSDLRIDTFRAGGPGGQNVQKNATAVRITHTPTGITVSCQNQRSQSQNRETAMRILRSRLLDLKRQQEEEQLAEIKGEHVQAEWGSQIRSYVLHPYQLVKDHRTEHETGNTSAVLDGDLDGFIEAYLRSTVGEAA